MKRGSRIDEWLTLLFMLLAIAAAISYFAVSNRMIFILFAGLAVTLRIIQYLLRFFP